MKIPSSCLYPLVGSAVGFCFPALSDVFEINAFSAVKATFALFLLVLYARGTRTIRTSPSVIFSGVLSPVLVWGLPDPNIIFCFFSLAPTFFLVGSRDSKLLVLSDGLMFALCIWLGPGSWILDDLSISPSINAFGASTWMVLWGLMFLTLKKTLELGFFFVPPVFALFDLLRVNDVFQVPYFTISRLFPSSALTFLPGELLPLLAKQEWILGMLVSIFSIIVVGLWKVSKKNGVSTLVLLPLMITPVPTISSAKKNMVFNESMCAAIQPDRLAIHESKLSIHLQKIAKEAGQDCQVLVAPSYSRVALKSSSEIFPSQIHPSQNPGSPSSERMLVFGDVTKVSDTDKNGYHIFNSACVLPINHILESEVAPCQYRSRKVYPVPLVEKPLFGFSSALSDSKDLRPLGFFDALSSDTRILRIGNIRAVVAICWEAAIAGVFSTVDSKEWETIDLIIVISDLSTLGDSQIEAWQAQRDMRLLSRIHRKPSLYVGVHGAFAMHENGDLIDPIRDSENIYRW